MQLHEISHLKPKTGYKKWSNLHEISVCGPQLNPVAAQPARSIEQRCASREESVAATGRHGDGGDRQLLEQDLEYFHVDAFLALVVNSGREKILTEQKRSMDYVAPNLQLE